MVLAAGLGISVACTPYLDEEIHSRVEINDRYMIVQVKDDYWAATIDEGDPRNQFRLHPPVETRRDALQAIKVASNCQVIEASAFNKGNLIWYARVRC